MQEFEDFTKAVANVGAAVVDAKAKGEKLKTAVDAKLEEVGKNVASDTAIPKS